jgi:hypothetical protein
MKLEMYLHKIGLTGAAFAKRIGVSRFAVYSYIGKGKKTKIPSKEIMGRIFDVTEGLVDANDFNDLVARENGEPREHHANL